MADATDDEAAAAKKKKKKMMIGGLVAAGLAYQFVLKKPPPAEDAAAAAAAAEEMIEEGEVAPLEELVVNLADQDEIHYARIGVGVVLEMGIATADIELELAKVSDIVIDIVSTKTFDELRTPGATTALKDEISAAARAAFDDERVMRVIFTTFVTQ